MSFTRDQTKIIIQEYEKYPELYDKQNPLYKNKNKRQECLDSIADTLREASNNFDIKTDEVKKKIHVLRTQYFNEIAKIRKSQANGTGAYYKTSWWCFKLLYFLRNNACAKRGSSNNIGITSLVLPAMKEEDESSAELFYDSPLEDFEGVEIENIVSPHLEEYSLSSSQFIESPYKKLKTERQTAIEIDHCDAFGQLVTAELRRVKDKKKINSLKRSIMDLLLSATDEDDD